MAFTSTHLDTPIGVGSERLAQVTVNDPSHPLYGRTFTLFASTGSSIAIGQVLVVYRDDVLLRIPAAATSLCPETLRPAPCKLSIGGVRELVRLAKRSGRAAQRARAHDAEKNCSGDESKPGASGFHGSLRGEP
jgi:hypothetical protein